MPRIFCTLIILLGLVVSSAPGQSDDPKALESRIKKLEAQSGEGQEETLGLLRETLALAKQRDAATARAKEFADKLVAVSKSPEADPTKAVELAPDEQAPEASTDGASASSAATVAALKTKLATARTEVQAHTEEEKSRVDNLTRIPALIEEQTAALAAIPKDETDLAASDLEQAKSEQLQMRAASLEQSIAALQAEREYIEKSAGFFSTEGARKNRRLAALTESYNAWRTLVDQARLADAQAAEAAAKKKAEDTATLGSDPAPAARKLAQLAARRSELTRKISAANQTLTTLTALDESVTRDFANATRRVKLLGDAELHIDPSTGRLLRKQRQELPKAAYLRGQLRDSLAESAEIQIALFERETELSDTIALAASSGVDATEQVEALESIIKDSRLYQNTLTEISSRFRNLERETTDFAKFIDERLLWIRSNEPFAFRDFATEAKGVQALWSQRPANAWFGDFRKNTILWTAMIALIVILIIRIPAHRKMLAQQSDIAAREDCTSFFPTAKAVLFTTLIAAPLPLIGWFLFARSGGASEGVGAGIRNASGFLTFLCFFFVSSRRDGLLAQHFRIGPRRISLVRKNLAWFIPSALPLVFFATALPIDAGSAEAAGRIFFIVLLVILATFLGRLLSPKFGLVRWDGEIRPTLSKFCFFLGLTVPVALIVGAACGYYASVQQLRIQALASVGLILVTLFVAALLYRWILVIRRRVAVREAEAALAAEASEEGSPDLEESLDIAARSAGIGEQTRRLVRATFVVVLSFGIWHIWLPSIPALTALDGITIWDTNAFQPAADPSVATLNPATDTDSALPATVTRTEDGVVSLQDLLFAFLSVFLTFVAAKNIPGLVGLVVLQRIRLEPGSSYALTTTIRYFIVFVGLVVAFGWIDVTWGKVQWLAAAMTVGIGFGLQEIFANFVAGIIILYERPIRLGDVVTVSDVSGKVSQIRIRATTIRQFNDRELIVPNKEFITGKLVNWTLTDSILRFEILVGIAYGSDTRKAREILLRIAAEEPAILDEPKPVVLFTAFGDSALNFELRAHVGQISDLLPMRDALHYRIDDAFREAGIEIAFPQTDLHIRSGLITDEKEPPRSEPA